MFITSGNAYEITLPDNDPSGAVYPVRTRMYNTAGYPIYHSTVCLGGTVTGESNNVNRIVLNTGESCTLTIAGNAGTSGGLVTYTGTLRRTGDVYSLDWGGTTMGSPFTPYFPDIDVSGNGQDIPNGDNSPSTIDDTDFGSANIITGKITHTFTITNSGTGDADLDLTGTPKVIIFGNDEDFTVTTQPSTPVAPGGGTTTFTIQFDPVTTGTRTAIVSIANNYAHKNPYNFTIQGNGAVAPEIDVQRPINTSIADDGTDGQGNKEAKTQITLTYTLANTGNAILTISNITKTNESNVTIDDISPTAFTVAADSSQTFIVKYTPIAAGAFSFDFDITNDDADEANYDITVSGDAGPNEAETAQFTRHAIQNFLGMRIRNITSQGPSISGFLNGDGMGGSFNGFGSGPVGLSFSGDLDQHQGFFSTSLQQFSNLQRRSNALTLSGVLPAGHALPDGSQNSYHSPVNIWVKGRWTHSKEDRGDIDEKSDFSIIYLGTDYRFSPDLLIGIMGQLDWSDERSDGLNGEAKGKGWMLGPYVVTRLNDNVILDLRGAWGQSDNEINPLGTYWDDFDTERWQIEGHLTGDYRHGKWNISPSIGLNYFEETQKAYTDSNGFRIDKQTMSLGSLNFGPTVTYTINGTDGSFIRPMLGVKGIWDFDSPDINDVNGIGVGTEGLRAQVIAGLNLRLANGTSFQGTYTYDGIGKSDFESHTGELSLVIPLTLGGLPERATLKASYSLQGTRFLNGFDQSNNEDHSAKISVKIPFD